MGVVEVVVVDPGCVVVALGIVVDAPGAARVVGEPASVDGDAIPGTEAARPGAANPGTPDEDPAAGNDGLAFPAPGFPLRPLAPPDGASNAGTRV